jgi:hypothetical protein
MSRRFISEPIVPDTTTFDTARMAAGEPGLPMRFSWRGRTFRVAKVLNSWRQTGECRHGSGERYVRKHWYEVLTDAGSTMTLYCDRQARSTSQRTRRWWLYTKETEGGEPSPPPHSKIASRCNG